MDDTILRLTVSVAACAVVVWMLHTGPIYGQSGPTLRDERPNLFWIFMVLLSVISMVAAVTAVLEVFR